MISRGRRKVDNAFGILVTRLRVLLSTIGQRPKVLRDIVLTCIDPQDTPMTQNDLPAINEWSVCGTAEIHAKATERPTERLLHVSALPGQQRI